VIDEATPSTSATAREGTAEGGGPSDLALRGVLMGACAELP